ncbi:MAG: hypothetical protein ACJ70O_06685 [Nitrososphaera sp.]
MRESEVRRVLNYVLYIELCSLSLLAEPEKGADGDNNFNAASFSSCVLGLGLTR